MRSAVQPILSDSDITVEEEVYAVARLNRDLRAASENLSEAEAGYLVESYYNVQELRIRCKAQTRKLGEFEKPHVVITWLGNQAQVLENQIQAALDRYTSAHRFGAWPRSILGIGPVITAGLISHIYMGDLCSVCKAHTPEDCELRQKKTWLKLPPHGFTPVPAKPTAGHLWAYAGLNPNQKWEPGQLRPWDPDLKVLCWKCGQSFLKTQNNPKDIYGKIYKSKKEIYIARNEAGGFADNAADALKKRRWDTGKDAYKAYVAGKLPPAHIDAMARRYAVKLFLAHLWEVWWRIDRPDQEPVLPYPIVHLSHAHVIPPPNFSATSQGSTIEATRANAASSAIQEGRASNVSSPKARGRKSSRQAAPMDTGQ